MGLIFTELFIIAYYKNEIRKKRGITS